MAQKLSANEIFSLLREGGFSDSAARTMTAIAQAESARDPKAIGDVGLQTGTWGPSVGLFQVRTLRAEQGTGGDRDIERLLADPREQVKAAFAISNGGTNFKPWSTFTHGTFRKFLDEPLQQVPVGSFGGAGSAAFAPGGGDPFAIDAGVKPTAVIVDTDHDGLTDEFEKLFGTDINKIDSDGDGLSDAFETSRSHTDPLSVDTDKDGLADNIEVARGTGAGQAAIPDAVRAAGFGGLDGLDSDKDGLSDGFEKRIGSNALLADSDKDGLSDAVEVARGLNPNSVDTDNDGLTDAVDTATSPLFSRPGQGVPGQGVPGQGFPGQGDFAGIPGSGGGIPGSGGGIPGSGTPGGSEIDYDHLQATGAPGDHPDDLLDDPGH